ncbi:MAG TPA: NAD(P)H-dependent oxidoreductase [Candidatus Methylacidiphilales bacterium]|jgi:FMN-dependent NADH-azoreductase|nr:NAD(P)H-dependent oxidoreductase [Candidatus Methylacidiphilales bacterium]
MAKLLHIVASPRGKRSASIAVAEHFIDSYRAAHPGDTVETLDLWHAALPEFDGPTIDAKYAILHGQKHTPEQLQAWQAVVKIADHFKSADKYLFSLPMWNFGIPYKLKHFIDVLVQPGLTFSFTQEEGYKGLVTGKPVVAVYARGGAYGAGSGMEAYDAQSPYLRQALGFIGFTNIREIFVEPTLASPTSKDEAVAASNRKAAELAAAF